MWIITTLGLTNPLTLFNISRKEYIIKTILQSKRFWLLAGLFFGLLAGVNGSFFFTADKGAYGLELGQSHELPAGVSLVLGAKQV